MKTNSLRLKINFVLILFFGIFGLAKSSWAATYYIDYASGNESNNGLSTTGPWKRAPGMTGFSGSYSHLAGDVFVFKGGVTWPLNMMNSNLTAFTLTNGGSGINSEDVYMGGQRCGQTGSVSCNGNSVWGNGYPLFDGGGIIRGLEALIDTYGKANLIFDGLKLYNAGTGTNNQRTMGFNILYGKSNITIKNCWIEPLGVEGISYEASGAVTGFYVYNNHFKEAGRYVIYAQQTDGESLTDLQIHDNLMEGPGNLDIGGFHGDGWMIGPTTGTPGSSYTGINNFLYYNNRHYGDLHIGVSWQLGFSGSNARIYNNVFSVENSTSDIAQVISPAILTLDNGTNQQVYNNTFSSDSLTDGRYAAACVFIAERVAQVTIKGNVFSKCGSGIWTAYNGIVADNNLYFTNTHLIAGSPGCDTLSACQTRGYEINGIFGDPKFVALPSGGVAGSGDFGIQASSPAKDALPRNQAPTTVFTTDILGVYRPQGAAWDIGAYEYMPGGDTTPAAGPPGLIVN